MDFKSLRKELRSENSEAALKVAQRAVAGGEVSHEDIITLGKLLQPKLAEQPQTVTVRFTGQWTADWLAQAFTAYAWGGNLAAVTEIAPYDSVMQTLISGQGSNEYEILLPWVTKIKDYGLFIDEQLAFWQQSWAVCGQGGKKIVQVGYDYTGPGFEGYLLSSKSGFVRTLRVLNERLKESLPKGAVFVDLEMLSGLVGRERFYSPRQYYWTKQPVTELGLSVLAKTLWAAVRALRTGPKKVLVLDLDNTLWGGVVGDLGANDVELGEGPEGEAYRSFQEYCKNLTKRGILLAVASKNDETNAKEPFEINPNMVLKLDDIVSFHAHWQPKSRSMRTIADELNLGIDSLVFFDDNPAEREEVRQNAPEVSVVDVPVDPSDYITALENSLLFETTTITAEDAERTKQYVTENKRKVLEQSFTNLDDYLNSLEMSGKLTPINDGNIQRVVQLLGKTNQFNLTTKRHDEATVRRLLAMRKAFGLTLELSDKFGDHGLIAVTLGIPSHSDTSAGGECILDTFLMSCRVLNRTTEQFFMNAVAEQAKQNGFQKIIGEYIPTAKNGLVKNLYPSFGFEPLAATEESSTFIVNVSDLNLKSFVRKG